MKGSDWRDCWKDFSSGDAIKEARKSVQASLEFNYQFQPQKKAIVEALVFWKFIRDNLFCESWETRRGFLREFFHFNEKGRLEFSNARLCGIVAIIECLPDSLWRKILWKYNIDFMSFESFLRRLTQGQADAIFRNYLEFLEANEIPEVFGWIDRHLKRISVSDLLEEKLVTSRRYSSKGEMSYNLLGLDFGFNAYPNGVNDDTKVVEISPLRFLSRKKHADDFIVNQEFGKYWWLYRRARSNYVWRPERKTELKTHICPGFWYTLIIHSVFWVFSPLALAVFVLWQPISGSEWWKILAEGISLNILFFLGLFTPLWLLAALIKTIWKFVFVPAVKAIWKFVDGSISAKKAFILLAEKSGLKWLHEWAKEKYVYGILAAILVFGVVTTVAVGIILFWGAKLAAEFLAALAFLGINWIVLVTIAGGIISGKVCRASDGEEDKVIFRALSFFFAGLSLFLILLSSQIRHLIFTMAKWIAFFVWDMIRVVGTLLFLAAREVAQFAFFLAREVAQFFIGAWQELGFFVFLPLLPFAVLALIVWVERKIEERRLERFFHWLDRSFVWFFRIIIGAIIFLLFLAIFMASFLPDAGMSRINFIALISLALAVFFAFLFVFSFERRRNPIIIKQKKKFRVLASSGNLSSLGVGYKVLMKNPLLLKGESYSRGSEIEEFGNILLILFPKKDDLKWAARIFLPKFNPEALRRMPPFSHEKWGEIIHSFPPFSFDLRCEILAKIFSGLDFREAVASVREGLLKKTEAEERREKIREKFWVALSFVLFPFYFLGKEICRLFSLLGKGIRYLFILFVFIVKKMFEIIITLKRLYVLFNEICPFVSKPRDLSKV